MDPCVHDTYQWWDLEKFEHLCQRDRIIYEEGSLEDLIVSCRDRRFFFGSCLYEIDVQALALLWKILTPNLSLPGKILINLLKCRRRLCKSN